jgi:hypothetical protein
MPKPALSPAWWPFEQPDILLSIRQIEHAIEQERVKTSTSIRDVSFQDFDDDEVDYSPSEECSDEEEEVEEELNEEELGGETGSWQDVARPMDLDIEDGELEHLARDIEENGWPSSPSP